MSNRAWVTLATNDSYGLGALVLAHSLRRAGSSYPAVVLITPAVTDAMKERLRAVFVDVVLVDVLDSGDAAHLALLQRPELGITFTKIHCWNLTQYEKCVFLDADTLVVQNCDELFEREELSAAPDVGWPDCFNSGVFVYKPSKETFDAIIKFAKERGSFDGGDQGLLNSFFSNWARGDINKHLPFLYNVTSAAFYSYLPALKHFGQDMKIIHFIGTTKPWLQSYNWTSHSVDVADHLKETLQLWWDIFVSSVHPQLDTTMVEEEAPPELPPQDAAHYYVPEVNPDSIFPWHHSNPEKPLVEEEKNQINMTQIFDPWERYVGNIPPKQDFHSEAKDLAKVEVTQELRDYAWEYKPPQQYTQETSHIYHSQQQHAWHHSSEPSHQHNHDQVKSFYPFIDNNQVTSYDSVAYENPVNSHNTVVNTSEVKPYNNFEHCNEVNAYNPKAHDNQLFSYFPIKHEPHVESHDPLVHKHENKTKHIHVDHQQVAQKVNYVHIEPKLVKTPLKSAPKKRRLNCIDTYSHPSPMINGYNVTEEKEDYEEVRPRHPYDGFYLRHKTTFDPRGKKTCIHAIIPPTPPPTPPEDSDEYLSCSEDQDFNLGSVVEQSGVAGNLARVVPGAPSQGEALDELSRRQGWEAGNIDYMGADSFANIWAKISQTLNQAPKQPSPPKERTPPPKQQSPPKDLTPSLKEPTPPKEQPAVVVETKSAETSPKLEAEDLVSAKPIPINEESSAAPTKEDIKKEPDVTKSDLPLTVCKTESKTPVQPEPEQTKSKSPSALNETKPGSQVQSELTKSELPSDLNQNKTQTPLLPEAPTEKSTTAKADVVKEPPKSDQIVEKLTETKPKEKTELVEVPPTPPASPKSTPDQVSTPVTEIQSPVEILAICPTKAEEPIVATPTTESGEKVEQKTATVIGTPATSKIEITPEKSLDSSAASSDSPPLANTPAKEEVPPPVAKLEGEKVRKSAGKLQLVPPSVADPLPTPDSELEDAATLAQSIIASELATPTVTSPTPPAPLTPSSPPLAPLLSEKRLSVDELPPDTPPAGPVSLSQIGVKPKPKSNIAAQIESSITEKAPESPTTGAEPDASSLPSKKKVVKKVVKKEVPTAVAADAPVPPPRKKEKKPKDK